MHKRVLVPLDSSAVPDSVVSAILKFAGVGGVEVALLRFMRPPPTDVVKGSRHELGDRVFAPMDEAQESMARIGVQLRARGVRVSTTHVRQGAPASGEILATARETGADFIAMPMHGRGEHGARPFDLVAEAVLRRATVPVLMVPPERRLDARRLGLTLRAGPHSYGPQRRSCDRRSRADP
jgi:nucleotide-binding universal stress UspA family protein